MVLLQPQGLFREREKLLHCFQPFIKVQPYDEHRRTCAERSTPSHNARGFLKHEKRIVNVADQRMRNHGIERFPRIARRLVSLTTNWICSLTPSVLLRRSATCTRPALRSMPVTLPLNPLRRAIARAATPVPLPMSSMVRATSIFIASKYSVSTA